MRKNMNIDQTKLDRVKEALGVGTETEAGDPALALVLLRGDLLEGIGRSAGGGGVEDGVGGDRDP